MLAYSFGAFPCKYVTVWGGLQTLNPVIKSSDRRHLGHLPLIGPYYSRPFCLGTLCEGALTCYSYSTVPFPWPLSQQQILWEFCQLTLPNWQEYVRSLLRPNYFIGYFLSFLSYRMILILTSYYWFYW